MLTMSITNAHSLGATISTPTTNDVNSIISTKLSCINFKALHIAFGGKHSSHSEENDHDDDDDDGDGDNKYEHEKPMLWLHHN